MELLIVCHAEATSRSGVISTLDGNLTANGMKQSCLTGMWLNRNINIKGYVGFVSPYLKTLQTASAISEVTGIDFTVDERLQDFRLDKIGLDRHFEAISIENRSLQFQNIMWNAKVWCDESRGYPAEDIEELVDRTKEFYDHIFTEHSKVAVITHSLPVIILAELASGKAVSDLKKRCKDLIAHMSSEGTIMDGWERHMFMQSVKPAGVTLIGNEKVHWFSRLVYSEFH